jgi:hypothetical protein
VTRFVYDEEGRPAVTEQVSFEDIKQLFRETDRKMQDTDRKLARLGKQYGDLGNRLGEFVEGMVRPGLVRMFRTYGLDVRETQRDVDVTRDGVAVQIDLLVVDDTDMVAVEVKSKLTIERVDEHVERLSKFKRAFPRYAGNRVLGAVAAMVIPEEVARYAEKHGMFVIGQAGDDAVLLNSAGFEPRAW